MPYKPVHLLALLAAPALVAQAPAATHTVTSLTPTFAIVEARGGTVGVWITESGVVLVDSQFEAALPGLLEAVKRLTPKPLRYLVNTHHHGDHVGGNPLVAAQGVRVVAHAAVPARMVKDQAKLDPAKRGGLPEVLVGEATGTQAARGAVALGGETMVLYHFGPGHTDGDLVVWLPKENVLHMGDLFFHRMLPFIDTQSGGTARGYLACVEAALALGNAQTRVVAGHGPATDLKGLGRFRDFLKAVVDHAAKHPGLDAAALAARFDRAAWPEIQETPTFVTYETLFGAVLGTGPGRVVR